MPVSSGAASVVSKAPARVTRSISVFRKLSLSASLARTWSERDSWDSFSVSSTVSVSSESVSKSLVATGTHSCPVSMVRDFLVFAASSSSTPAVLMNSTDQSFFADSATLTHEASFVCPLFLETLWQSRALEIIVRLRDSANATFTQQVGEVLVLDLNFDPMNLSISSAVLNNASISPTSLSLLFMANNTEISPSSFVTYPLSVVLMLHRSTFESCLSTNNSILLFNCSDSGPVLAAPAVAAATAAVVQTAIAGSVAVAATGGPASAGDVQSTAIVVLSPCARGPAAKAGPSPGDYKLVSPVALWDSPVGALTGNALLFFTVLAAQLTVAGLLYAFSKDETALEIFARIRFPGLSLMVAASLHQSTLFSALHIMVDGGDQPAKSHPSGGRTESDGFVTSIGVFALCASFAFPACLVVAASRVPRRFLRYDFEAVPDSESPNGETSISVSTLSRVLPWLRPLVPFGTVHPIQTNHMLSSLVTAFRHPSPWCVVVPFISSFAVNFASLAAGSTCSLAMIVSGIAHVSVAVLAVYFRIYNSPIGGAMSCLGLLLLALVQFLVAANEHSIIAELLLFQAVLSVVRSVVTFTISRVDDSVRKHQSTRTTAVMWSVGGERNFIPKWFSNSGLKAELDNWVPRWFSNSKKSASTEVDLDHGEDGAATAVLMVPMNAAAQAISTDETKKKWDLDDPFSDLLSNTSRTGNGTAKSASDRIGSGSFTKNEDLGLAAFASEEILSQMSDDTDPFACLDDAGDDDDDDDPFSAVASSNFVTAAAAPPQGAANSSVVLSEDDSNSDLDETVLDDEQMERLRNHNRLKRELESFFKGNPK